MKKIVQFTERDLRQLIWEELDRTGENEDLAPLDIQFVTNAMGQVSALVRGFDYEVDEVSGDILPDDKEILEDVVFLVFRKDEVRKDGATLDDLVKAVVREFEAQGKSYSSSEVQAGVERYLTALEKNGTLAVFKVKGDDRWKFKPLKGKELKVPSTGIVAADVLRGRTKKSEHPTFSFDLIKQMTEKAVVRRGATGEVLDIAEVTAKLLLDETPTEFSPDHRSFHEFVSKLEPSVKVALEQLAEDGIVELEPMEEGEDLEYWRKKQKSKSKGGAAADILRGSGGVMDRSEALGEGVAEESPSSKKRNGGRKRPGVSSRRRPTKKGRKKGGGGTPPPRGGFPFDFGSGTPFSM